MSPFQGWGYHSLINIPFIRDVDIVSPFRAIILMRNSIVVNVDLLPTKCGRRWSDSHQSFELGCHDVINGTCFL